MANTTATSDTGAGGFFLTQITEEAPANSEELPETAHAVEIKGVVEVPKDETDAPERKTSTAIEQLKRVSRKLAPFRSR